MCDRNTLVSHEDYEYGDPGILVFIDDFPPLRYIINIDIDSGSTSLNIML